jgi:hypothetical protein
MSKKWYSFFVVADSPEQAPGVPAVSASEVGEGGEPIEISGPLPDTAPVQAIYEAARIATPPHGYTILKVAEMLESEHIRELPADVRRKSVLVALDAAKVSIKDIVADAVQRDRALDTYERLLEKNLESLRTATAEENARLESEIARHMQELRARTEQNGVAVARAQEQLARWRFGKQAEEARIADAVSYFVSENPITRPPGGQGAGKDVR